MSGASLKLKPKQQRALERFYFHEARLLDNRQYQQWLALVDEDIRYTMPSRINLMVDNRERGSEEMISVERELEGTESMGGAGLQDQFLVGEPPRTYASYCREYRADEAGRQRVARTQQLSSLLCPSG